MTAAFQHRGFTLIELLVIIAIMGIMVTIGAVSISSGKGAARVKGATRDIFAAIRHARSTALVTCQPVVITYSTEDDAESGEVIAKVEITSAKLLDTSTDRSKVQTLTGEPLKVEGQELVHIEEEEPKTTKKSAKPGETTPVSDESAGDSLEDILFAPISTEVVKGMRLKVAMGDEVGVTTETARPSKISVFSNVDYLLGRYKEKKAADAKKAEETAQASGTVVGAKADKSILEEKQEPVSVVWETNGRVDAHQVWVYADGQKPEDGLLIKIDQFGAAKVLRGDGHEDD